MTQVVDWMPGDDLIVIDDKVWQVVSATPDPSPTQAWLVTLVDTDGCVKCAMLEKPL